MHKKNRSVADADQRWESSWAEENATWRALHGPDDGLKGSLRKVERVKVKCLVVMVISGKE